MKFVYVHMGYDIPANLVLISGIVRRQFALLGTAGNIEHSSQEPTGVLDAQKQMCDPLLFARPTLHFSLNHLVIPHASYRSFQKQGEIPFLLIIPTTSLDSTKVAGYPEDYFIFTRSLDLTQIPDVTIIIRYKDKGSFSNRIPKALRGKVSVTTSQGENDFNKLLDLYFDNAKIDKIFPHTYHREAGDAVKTWKTTAGNILTNLAINKEIGIHIAPFLHFVTLLALVELLTEKVINPDYIGLPSQEKIVKESNIKTLSEKYKLLPTADIKSKPLLPEDAHLSVAEFFSGEQQDLELYVNFVKLVTSPEAALNSLIASNELRSLSERLERLERTPNKYVQSCLHSALDHAHPEKSLITIPGGFGESVYDGSCFYDSVLTLLNMNHVPHNYQSPQALQQAALNHVIENMQSYSHFLTNPNAYINYHLGTGSENSHPWADAIMIEATAHIVQHQVSTPLFDIEGAPIINATSGTQVNFSFNPTAPSDAVLTIANIGNIHFVPQLPQTSTANQEDQHNEEEEEAQAHLSSSATNIAGLSHHWLPCPCTLM